MKNIFVLINCILISTCSLAKNQHEKKTTHREHEAHVHGGGTLSIAFDDNRGKIEFKGAAEGILGFEHKPKTEKDKKIVSNAISEFEKNISKLVSFDQSLNCIYAKESIGQIPESGHEGSGEHSDWEANFTVKCEHSLIGTKLIIDFTLFNRIKDLDITVLVGSVQKSAEYKGEKPVVIELK